MNDHDPVPNPLDPAPSPAPSPAARPTAASAQAEPMERLLQELIKDRRVERRWKAFFRLAWLALAVMFVVALMPSKGLHSAPAGPHTAVVDLRGEIAEGTLASADLLISALRDAFGNPNAVAVVLRINSPGGSPVQAGMVNDEINRLRTLHDKKVYAVVEEVCASGAYYIAAATDEIYVDKASIVGSIGVLMDGFGFTGVMDKLGVERRLITAGEHKGMLDPFSPAKPKERELAQAMINQIHQQFIDVVKAGRGDRLKVGPDTFSGLFWNGEEAIRQGLADELGSVDQVARDVVKAPDVVDYSPQENVAERLAKRFGASIGAGAVSVLRQAASLR